MKNALEDRIVSILLVNGHGDEQPIVDQLAEGWALPYRTLTSNSCQDGLDKLNANKIDIIILEYYEDKQDYAEFLDKVDEDIPVIFLTNFENQEITYKTRKEGIFDHLIRDPARKYLSSLPLAIDELLKRREQQKSLKSKVNKLTYSCSAFKQSLEKESVSKNIKKNFADINKKVQDLENSL